MTETHREVDINGFVEIRDNPISKVGVYPYLGSMIGAPEPERIYAVLRPAEELGGATALDSLRLMPLVDDHEMLGDGETPAEQKGIHGVIGESVYFLNGTIYGNIKIHSDSLLNKIDDGKKELSAGYRADHEFTSGVFEGEGYDAIQRNIIFNHVALVDKGRMGGEVSVLDEGLKKMADVTDEALKAKIKAIMDELKAEEKDDKDAIEDESEDEKDKDDVEDEDEDSEDDDKKDVEDEDDAEEKDKKSGVMDAALVAKTIKSEVAKALGQIGRRDELYTRLKPLLGVFDSQTMTAEQLAQYGVKKLGIACKKGHEEAALAGYLAGSKSAVTDSAGPDYAPATATKISLKDFE